jgi:L-galactose dehydrogenase
MNVGVDVASSAADLAAPMANRRLGNTELLLSSIGFGASPLGDVFGQTSPDADADTIACAIDGGINFFDVSPYYGLTKAETRLGTALKGRRKEVVLATKCGRYGTDEFDFSARRITRGLEDSLRRLQTDSVDLLQAHDTEFAHVDQIVEETIPAMRRLQHQGKARFIGITGYSLSNLLAIAERVRVDSILSYCRYNLMITDLDYRLLPFVQQHNIGLINASPLHMGLLTEHGAPSWHPASEAVKARGRAIVELCNARGLSPSTLAIQFACAHPYVASTLVGMATRDQVQANLDALRQPMDEELLRAVRNLAEPAANQVWTSGLPENYG